MQSNVETAPTTAELFQQARSYAYGFTRNLHDAEDLVQHAWMKLTQKYHEVSDRRLLFRAIRNLFIDGVRRSKIVQFDPLDDFDFFIGKDEDFGNEHDVESLLSVLNENERRFLHMNAIEGYTATEISEKTGVPRGTILSHTHRAKKKLRVHFENEFNTEQEEKEELAAAC